MSGATIVIIGGTGTNGVPKDFGQIYDIDGFQVTNSLAETATVHFTSVSGAEEGTDIGISSNSTIILGGGWLAGVP